MKEKLLLKYAQGYRGWNDRAYQKELQRLMTEHCIKEIFESGGFQCVDIANFAMMLHRFKIQ
jgi:hypothetical protein